MKKIVVAFTALILMMIVAVFLVSSTEDAHAWGNQSWFDTTWSFEHAQVDMKDGTCVKGKVETWQDYENSDVVQVKIDGKVYLTHYMNVVLVSE